MQRLMIKKSYNKNGKYADHIFQGGGSHEVTDIHIVQMMNEWLNEQLKNRHVLSSQEGRDQFLNNIDIDVREDDPENPLRSKKDRFNGVVEQLSVDNKPNPYRDIVPDSKIDVPHLVDKHRESLSHASTILGYDVVDRGFDSTANHYGNLNQAIIKTLELEDVEGIENGLKGRLESIAQGVESGSINLDEKDRSEVMAATIVGIDESAPYSEWEKAIFDKMSPLRERDNEELLSVAGERMKERHGFTEEELDEFSREVSNANEMHANRQKQREVQRQNPEGVTTPAQEAFKPKPLHGSHINMKVDQGTSAPSNTEEGMEEKAAEEPDEVAPEAYSFSDLTAEQKASLKTIGVYGDNTYQDMNRMREVQVRTMFADYLQNTPEGQKEFEQYVQRTSKSAQERNGVKAEDLYENRMAYLMQIDSAKMEEQFPEAAKALSEERASIDVSEELDIIKREIDPEVDATPEAKKAAVEDLRMQKQIDRRIGPEGQPSLSERIKNSAKNGLKFRKEDGSINKTKILTTSLAGLGMGAAVLGGPAGIAAYIGVKTAVHHAKKAIYAQENFDKGVINALDKGGLASPETIEKKKQEIAEKEQGKSKWSKFLKGAAVLGVGIAAGIAIGDIAGDDIKTGFKDLYEGGMELFKNADLSSGSTIGDGITELQEGIVTEAANNLDPDASVGPTNGDATPEVVEEAIDAAVEVAGSMAPEVDQEAVDAAVEVAGLTHTVQPGDTMSQIAVDYLKQQGVSFTTSDLYGPDGILAQAGMNEDLIVPGQEVDLTKLEGYIQSLGQENNLAPGVEANTSGLDMNSESSSPRISPSEVDNVFPTNSPAHDAANHAFLANLAENRPDMSGVESSADNGHSWAGEPAPDDAVRLGGGSPAASPSIPEAAMERAMAAYNANGGDMLSTVDGLMRESPPGVAPADANASFGGYEENAQDSAFDSSHEQESRNDDEYDPGGP